MTGSRTRRYVLLCTFVVLAIALSGGILPHPAQAGRAQAASPVAHVRYIQHGLTVQPPHAQAAKGKVKQSLFTRYGLQTRAKEKASINFQDGTLLHLNQLTTAVLRSTSVTQIKSGEVEEQVVPGTNHQVQTAAANASAVGTIFDVLVQGKVTIITVVEGAVLVTTPQGTVLVRSGEQVRITKGQAPPQPTPVDAAAATAWSASIPRPATPIGTNLALDANGGQIYRWTSQREDPGHAFDARNADDGSAASGWQSAASQTADQSLWVRFQGLRTYTITGVFLVCAATNGQDPADAAQHFEVLASSDPSDGGSSFSSVFSGTCAQQSGIQVFPLSGSAADARAAVSGVKAAALQFHFQDNHGGKDGIAVAEIGVIGQEMPAVLGTPTPEPTDTPAPTPTDTPVPTATFAPDESLSGPNRLDFGTWLFDQTSTRQTVTITNNGTVATGIQSVMLQQSTPGVFAIAGDTCSRTALRPNATCTVSLTFQPTFGSGATGTLMVTYGASGKQLAIPISGHGVFLLMSVPALQASWTNPFDGSQQMVSADSGMICADANLLGFTFLINAPGANNAVSSHVGAMVSQPTHFYAINFRNQGTLVWGANMFFQLLGVGTGSVQIQVTAQLTGSGSTFKVDTPMVTPTVSQVDQCPANLQPTALER